MREKIRAILGHHLDGNDKDYENAIDKILRLFNVSGNEANPKENKKDGEVTLSSPKQILELAGETISEDKITEWTQGKKIIAVKYYIEGAEMMRSKIGEGNDR